MVIEEYLEEGEKVRTMIQHDYPIIKRTKIVGMTDKRSFMYWRSWNKKRFASSNRSLSHIEYGDWRMPIWMWILLGIAFLGPITLFFKEGGEYIPLAIGLLVFPSILAIICIMFRRFTYLGTAIGTEFIHIICRKGSFEGDGVDEFLRKIHLGKPFGRPVTEQYVKPNYFSRRIRFYIVILTIVSVLTSILSFSNSLEIGGI